MDVTTVAGIVGSIGLILLGQALEGGHVGSILQATAALIVFGGTIGAVAVAYPKKDFVMGLKLVKLGFSDRKFREFVLDSTRKDVYADSTYTGSGTSKATPADILEAGTRPGRRHADRQHA